MRYQDVIVLGHKAIWDKQNPEACVIDVFPFELHFNKPYDLVGGLPSAGVNWMLMFNHKFSSTIRSTAIKSGHCDDLEKAVVEAQAFVCQMLSQLGDDIEEARKWKAVTEVHDS